MKGKTTLRKKILNSDNPSITESQEFTHGRIIKGKTSLGKNKNRIPNQNEKKNIEENISQHLVEQIVLTFFASKWQKKISDLKNRVSSKPNKKAKDLRSLVRVLERAINYHTYLYLMELFDNMSVMPFPSGLTHDKNYGKVFLVNKKEIIIEEPVIKKEKIKLREKVEPNINENKNKEEYPEELSMYYYRSDGKPLDRVEIEKDINRLIEEYPEKDIDVERILNSKRLQYKLKHPRFSPFSKKENLDSFVRYLYTYKPSKIKDKTEKTITIKNKTYCYY